MPLVGAGHAEITPLRVTTCKSQNQGTVSSASLGDSLHGPIREQSLSYAATPKERPTQRCTVLASSEAGWQPASISGNTISSGSGHWFLGWISNYFQGILYVKGNMMLHNSTFRGRVV